MSAVRECRIPQPQATVFVLVLLQTSTPRGEGTEVPNRKLIKDSPILLLASVQPPLDHDSKQAPIVLLTEEGFELILCHPW